MFSCCKENVVISFEEIEQMRMNAEKEIRINECNTITKNNSTIEILKFSTSNSSLQKRLELFRINEAILTRQLSQDQLSVNKKAIKANELRMIQRTIKILDNGK